MQVRGEGHPLAKIDEGAESVPAGPENGQVKGGSRFIEQGPEVAGPFKGTYIAGWQVGCEDDGSAENGGLSQDPFPGGNEILPPTRSARYRVEQILPASWRRTACSRRPTAPPF